MKLALAAGALLFVIVATANSGGYKFGASDQAFYVPAVERAIDPSLFPRDGWLLDAQGNAILWDGFVAALVRGTGLSIETVFFLLYLTGLLLLYAGALLVARGLALQAWATLAFLALLTLRHRIAKTGVNTLEGYLHPRMIAFGLGTIAMGALLHQRPALAVAAVGLAGLAHPTTGVWFGLLLFVAAFVARPEWRRWLGMAAGAGVLAALALLAGPLAPRLVVMDATWLRVLETKDYLFPNAWPIYAWVTNLLSALVLILVWRRRYQQGLARPVETGLVAGALALVAFFLVTLPFVAAGVALAVQLQIPRVFWLAEFLAFAYLAWVFTRAAQRRTVAVVAIALALAAFGRGAYVLLAENPGRPLFGRTMPADDWHDAMRWLRTQPADLHVLADPGHAWKYGSSVRAGAARDVFHEDVKDAALAMYDRDVAMRVDERRALTHRVEEMTEDELWAFAAAHDLDVLVTERDLDLPRLYANARFRIYRLTSE